MVVDFDDEIYLEGHENNIYLIFDDIEQMYKELIESKEQEVQ